MFQSHSGQSGGGVQEDAIMTVGVLVEGEYTVYLLIYRTAKNNYFGNCPGIIGTDFYRACEVSGIIRTSKQLHAS